MSKVYERYEDLHVRKTYIYVKKNDVYAYADPDKTVKIASDDLRDLFLKGAVILDGTTEYLPISYVISSNVGTMTYVKTGTTNSGSTAVLATLKSKEYTAEG
jgi:hypothetical protein